MAVVFRDSVHFCDSFGLHTVIKLGRLSVVVLKQRKEASHRFNCDLGCAYRISNGCSWWVEICNSYFIL